VRIYLAGPMRGYPEYNFPTFDYAAKRLRQAGHEVVSPAELDRAVGVHEFTTLLPPGFMRGAMKRDLPAICDCDAIVLLPGWERSSGVGVEKYLADFLGLMVFQSSMDEHDIGETSLDGYMTDIINLIQLEVAHRAIEPTCASA